MKLESLLTDDAVIAELGRRLARRRLQSNLTQAELAQEAGIGTATLERLERGRPVGMTSMIRVLRALDLLAGLDRAVPESTRHPIAELERMQRSGRRRASGRGRGSPPAPPRPWVWGDDRPER